MIKINKKKNKKNGPPGQAGYALLEMIFYISLFAVVSVVVVNAMLSMTLSFKETTIQAELIQSGMMLEKISRELRQADDFSFVANTLIINTKDDSNNPKTITYAWADSNIQITDSLSGSLGNLNAPNIAVINFNLAPIITTKGKAAEILITVKSNNDTYNRTINFNDTIVLRGSYST